MLKAEPEGFVVVQSGGGGSKSNAPRAARRALPLTRLFPELAVESVSESSVSHLVVLFLSIFSSMCDPSSSDQMFHLLKVNATLDRAGFRSACSFMEMRCSGLGMASLTFFPRSWSWLPAVYFLEGLSLANIRSTGKAAAGSAAKRSRMKFVATMKNGVAMSGKGKEPKLCVRFAH